MNHNPYCLADDELQALLRDDCPYGDATTSGLALGAQPGRLGFAARQAMVVCGAEEALRLGELNGLRLLGASRISGEHLTAGENILTLEGPAEALHRVWKTAQTLMEYLSGIASATSDLVAVARQVNPRIGVATTRKHFPGTKAMSLKAVLAGGGSVHRLGLSDSILIFAEHRRFLAGEAPEAAIRRLRCDWPERLIAVEVTDEAAARTWQQAGADILQLDKLPPDIVQRIKAALPPGAATRISAAGGITPANAAAYAAAGADILVTSYPYSAAPRDVAVTLAPL